MKAPISKQALERLSHAVSQDAEKYLNEYAEILPKILKIYKRSDLQIADVAIGTESEDIDLLKVSLVMNDVTFVSMNRLAGPMHARVLFLHGGDAAAFRKLIGSDNLVFCLSPETAPLIVECLNENAAFASLMLADEPKANPLFSHIQPLLASGRLFVRPERVLVYDPTRLKRNVRLNKHKKVTPEARLEGTIGGGPLNVWYLPEERTEYSIPVTELEHGFEVRSKLFDVSIPFIDHLSLDEIARVLDDEHDVVAELRASLKATIRDSIKEPRSADRYRRRCSQSERRPSREKIPACHEYDCP
jgi:hypothetical protein